MRKKRIFWYVFSIRGFGHILRSIQIINELSPDYEVDLFCAKRPLPIDLDNPSFRLIEMETVYRSDYIPYRIPDSMKNNSIKRMNRRKTALRTIIQDQKYDFLVFEHYPFGYKYYLGDEARFILKEAKKVNPHLKSICSFRGINRNPKDLSPSMKDFDKAVNFFAYQFLAKHIDTILLHCDPNLIQLKRTFPVDSTIRQKMVYTGFVTAPYQPNANKKRKKQILVTGGGTIDSYQLFQASLKAVPLFPDYQWIFAIGPQFPRQFFETFKKLVDHCQSNNVQTCGYIENFHDALSESALTIGIAGDNLLAIYQTNTPGIIVADDQIGDQTIMLEMFEDKAPILELKKDSLTQAGLARLIHKVLAGDVPKKVEGIDLNGIKKTKEFFDQSSS